jgi:hypothetical protein
VAEVFEDMQVVANPGPGSLQVWFEPWGMPHALPQRQSAMDFALSSET